MAAFELNVDDSSPLISYAPAGVWLDSPVQDPLVQSYYDGSLHTTSSTGATVTVNFNGTGITVFGGSRPNYGTYTFAVDGVTLVNGSANSASPLLHQVLASTSGLQDGSHTAVLTNTGSQSSIDIDWLELQTRLGQSSVILGNYTIDDNSPLVTYGPSASDWVLTTNSSFIDNTTHFSTAPGAFAQLIFIGDAVAIYGTVSPDRADIQVSLDGIVSTTTGGSGGFVQQLHTQTLLYYRSRIGNGLQHTLTISAAPGSTGYVDVDAFRVFNATQANSTTGTTAGPTASNGNAPLTSPKTVAAIAVSVIVVFILLLVLLAIWVQRRKQNLARMSNLSAFSLELPIQGPGFDYGLGPSRRVSVQSASSALSDTPMIFRND